VYMCGRNQTLLDEKIQEIEAESAKGKAIPIALELGDLSSVRAAAKDIQSSTDRVHFLVNNAGVALSEKKMTKDGFEMMIGVCHFGHFLFTELLTPCLSNAAPARVVNVSSYVHYKSPSKRTQIDLDDLHYSKRKFNAMAALGQAKLANVLHAVEYNRRNTDKGIIAVSLHPGHVDTGFSRHVMGPTTKKLLAPVLNRCCSINTTQGAQTSLYCVLSDKTPECAGMYFSAANSPGGLVGTMYKTQAQQAGGWPMAEIPNEAARDSNSVVDSMTCR